MTFPGPRVAVFVDGCFWHGCPDHYVAPRTSLAFWRKKLRDNVDRDRRQTLILERDGWTVVRLWEHEIYTDLEESVDAIWCAVKHGEPDRRVSWRVVFVRTVDPNTDLEERMLEDLRDATRTKVVTQVRHTDKW